MHKIEAIIRPHLLDAVKEALQQVGVSGMTVTEVQGVGRHEGHTETYRGGDYTVDLDSKVKVEVAVPTEMLEPAVDAIANTARTWKRGDGRIFVSALEEVVRIRTGEYNEKAL